MLHFTAIVGTPRAWARTVTLVVGVAGWLSGCERSQPASRPNSAPTSTVDRALATPSEPARTIPLQMNRSDVNRSDDSSHATLVGALRDTLVGVAILDGEPITDVQYRSDCTTTFVTPSRTTLIDWSKVGNFAGRIEGKQAILPLSDGGGEHRFVMPDTDRFRSVDGGMGLLADECGAAR